MTSQQKDHQWIFIIAIVNLCLKSCTSKINSADSKNDFDYLVFTQSWPVTTCISFMEKREDNTCRLTSHKDIWTIHGIWPSKRSQLGPDFCNNAAPFDVNSLQPLMDQLRKSWPDLLVRKGTDDISFWKYEWKKHGMCSTLLEELNTANKYFSQALEWHRQYGIHNMLSKANIQPGSQYQASEIYNAIKTQLNVSPMIKCVKSKDEDSDGQQFLHEILLCFDKELKLIDCEGRRYKDGTLTNCDARKTIQYPSTLPKYLLDHDEESTAWRFLIHFFSIILIVVLVWFAYKSAKKRNVF